MRILIDISPIVYGTGVSVYTKNLVYNLALADKENEYVLFAGTLRRRADLESFLNGFQGRNFRGKVFPLPPTLADIVWNRLHIFKIEKLVGSMDVFHSSDWSQPPSGAFKVTTVHDLVPIKFPKLSHSTLVSAHTSRLKWIIKEVDRVIVPSDTTAEDLVKMGVESNRIRVISEAPDPKIKQSTKEEVQNLKRKYRISGKYLLAIGVTPRKNTERIIAAFEKIKGEIDLKLVIIGHQYANFHIPRGVLVMGHVPIEELSTFYSGAEVLVYPSLYEGFGLPILEAMVCKIPVVTSNMGSMAEVAGKAAVLVDPYNVGDIAEGISEAIKNREKFVKLGKERLKQFSWQKTAERTLEVYKESEIL